MAEGKTNPEIAQVLGISLDGAKWHVGALLEKLDVATREEAADYWEHSGESIRVIAPAWLNWLGLGTGIAASVASVAVGGAILLDRHRDSTSQPVQPAAPTETVTLVPTDLQTALSLTIQCLADRGIGAETVDPGGSQLPRLQLLPTQRHPETIDLAVRECRAEYLDEAMDAALLARMPDAPTQLEARQFVAQCIVNAGGQITTLSPEDADISQWMDSSDPQTRIAAGRCIEERYRIYGF